MTPKALAGPAIALAIGLGARYIRSRWSDKVRAAHNELQRRHAESRGTSAD